MSPELRGPKWHVGAIPQCRRRSLRQHRRSGGVKRVRCEWHVSGPRRRNPRATDPGSCHAHCQQWFPRAQRSYSANMSRKARLVRIVCSRAAAVIFSRGTRFVGKPAKRKPCKSRGGMDLCGGLEYDLSGTMVRKEHRNWKGRELRAAARDPTDVNVKQCELRQDRRRRRSNVPRSSQHLVASCQPLIALELGLGFRV